MPRWIPVALLLLSACGADAPADPVAPPADEPAVDVRPPPPPRPPVAPWLRELLAFDLRAPATDDRTIALGERLQSTVACPQPGTGCFVELSLGGHTTQVHVGDDQATQVWGPTDPLEMPTWVAGVEAEIDRSPLTAVNETGTRPDRLWRDARHVVLLHDHSTQRCGGFCPAMIWIAPPDHPAAPGYGFGDAPAR